MEKTLADYISFKQTSTSPAVFSLSVKKPANVFDIEIGVYTYGEHLNANSFKILPYDEYHEDLSEDKRSNYTKIKQNNVFGMFLVAIIIIFFAFFKPGDLFSVESIVSVFGAYIVGKEIWNDLVSFLVKLTENWPLKFKDQEFFFERSTTNTLSHFIETGRIKKNKQATILAKRFDFVNMSNSKIVELEFITPEKTNEQLHFANISFLEKYKNVTVKDFMLAAKINIHKGFAFITLAEEIFQVLDAGKVGIFEKNKLLLNKTMRRKTYKFLRFKVYGKTKLV